MNRDELVHLSSTKVLFKGRFADLRSITNETVQNNMTYAEKTPDPSINRDEYNKKEKIQDVMKYLRPKLQTKSDILAELLTIMSGYYDKPYNKLLVDILKKSKKLDLSDVKQELNDATKDVAQHHSDDAKVITLQKSITSNSNIRAVAMVIGIFSSELAIYFLKFAKAIKLVLNEKQFDKLKELELTGHIKIGGEY